jgi:DNA modification methylase
VITCENSGHRAPLIELDTEYVDVIVKRWQEFADKQATRVEDGIVFDSATGP